MTSTREGAKAFLVRESFKKLEEFPNSRRL
jgi:hypothetical protein